MSAANANNSSHKPPRNLRSRDVKRESIDEDGVVLEMGEREVEKSVMATASHYLTRVGVKRKEDRITIHNTPKKRRLDLGADGSQALQDVYCWKCHKECVDGARDCLSCPRSFHQHCLAADDASTEDWKCPVCTSIEAASLDRRSLSKDQLAFFLGHVLKRMKHSESGPFENAVPISLVPDYYELVFHPMDLSTLDKKVRASAYSSTRAFAADARWILHNSVIYNGLSTKYTNDARLIIKICDHEVSEVDVCPDCYKRSILRPDNWFAVPCSVPHCLVWAKLKGYPYWPAKVLRLHEQSVDVRFFGEYDRAWLPMSQCVLLSEQPPPSAKTGRRTGLDKAVEELRDHVRRLILVHPSFRFAPPRSELKAEHLVCCPPLFGDAPLLDLVAHEVSCPSPSSATTLREDLNGVFAMDETEERRLEAAGSQLSNEPLGMQGVMEEAAGTASDGSDGGSGILERLQSSLSDESPPETAAAQEAEAPAAEPAVRASPKMSSDLAAAAEKMARKPRKQNLDQLLQRMRGGATPKGRAAASSFVNVSVEKAQTTPAAPAASVHRHAKKVCDFVQEVFEDMANELSMNAGGDDASPNFYSELSKVRLAQAASSEELKRTTQLVASELRQSLIVERQARIAELQRRCDAEKQAAVTNAKSRQWCAQCGKESVFHCCWNTSYCDYPCQQAHWPKHQSVCAQIRRPSTEGTDPSPQHNNNSSVVYQLPAQAQTVPPDGAASAQTRVSTAAMQLQGGGLVYRLPSAPGQMVPVYAAPGLPPQGYLVAGSPSTATAALTLVQTAPPSLSTTASTNNKP